jgi:hypothetical protein
MKYADNHCKCKEEIGKAHTYTFTGPCVITGEEHSVTVHAADLFKYRQGAYIQDAFYYLSDDEMEFLMSGIGPGQFDSIFEE